MHHIQLIVQRRHELEVVVRPIQAFTITGSDTQHHDRFIRVVSVLITIVVVIIAIVVTTVAVTTITAITTVIRITTVAISRIAQVIATDIGLL